MIIFSFNDYQGKFNFVWHGFTLQGWLHPFDWPGLPDAIRTSLTIALAVDDRRDDPGHVHRPGPDALPVPRPGRRSTA